MKHWKTIVKTGLLLLILYLVFRAIDPKLLFSIMQQAHPAWLLWAVVWFILSKIIGAFRFNDLLKTDNIVLSTKQQLQLYWLGMYYNLLLPGGTSGDGYKIKVLMDAYGRPFKPVFYITLFDRLSGILALGQICLALAFWLPALKTYWWISLFGLIWSIPVSWLLFKRLIGRTSDVWLRTSVQSLGVQLTQLVATLGIVFALQQPAQWLGYSVVFMVSSVAAMMPLTIGGAGARELTFLWGAQVLQLNPERAVAIAFIFYLISTAVSLYGLTYSYKNNLLQTTTDNPS